MPGQRIIGDRQFDRLKPLDLVAQPGGYARIAGPAVEVERRTLAMALDEMDGGPGGLAKAKKGIAVSDPRNPNAPNTLEYGKQVASRLTTGQAAEAVPVQLAQVEGRVLPEQKAPVIPVETPVDPTWNQFQQAMPQQVQANDLQYGQAMPVYQAPQMDPRMVEVAQAPSQPNFSMFKRWRVRV